MPPISLTIKSEPPSTLCTLNSNGASVAATSANSATSPTWQCQICFDDLDDPQASEHDTTAVSLAVMAFCGSTCPAILCQPCTAEHVRVSVAAAFPGVLPKVRCPICLVQVNKIKWSHLVNQDVLTKYVESCRTACSFRTPCCENTTYTHLPRELNALDLPRKYIKPAELKLDAQLEQQLEPLAAMRQRFCDYEISAKDLIIFIEDTFGRHVKIETQHLIVEHELPKILDDERRATLLLAYHAKYKVVKTRCCGTKVCFNCKRKTSTHPGGETGSCDTGTLADASIVECRSCRVTMVKVEGCGAVRCWCGFDMSWDAEIRLRDRFKKGMIPVDIYDIKTYKAWERWQRDFVGLIAKKLAPQKHAIRLRSIKKQLLHTPELCVTLRKLVQRQYIWRGRFKRALPKMREEMVRVRMRILAKRLAKLPSFVEAVRRAVWRGRFKRALPKMREEMTKVRMLMLAKRLSKRTCFMEAVSRVKWWVRFARMLPKMREEVMKVRMLMLAKRLKKHGTFVVAVGRTKWRRRFARVLPKLRQEMVIACMRTLARRLAKHGVFSVAVGRMAWCRRFARTLPKLAKELAEWRTARCVKTLSKSEAFVEALRRAKWRARWTQVLKSVHAKRFWINYVREHPEEERALHDEEVAMLLPCF